MPKIHLETVIEAPRQLVFDMARDIDLHAQTVPWTKERALGEKRHGKLELGDLVIFDAIHFGVRQQLKAKITEYEYPAVFGDHMISGAFSSLRHVHRFDELSANSTLMIDDLQFVSPLGILGKVADNLFLERYMTDFLKRRNTNLKRIVEATVTTP